MDYFDLFRRLEQSSFRSRFHLGPKERQYIEQKGFERVLLEARDLFSKRVGPAQPAKDGKQTPYRGHPVFVAQHATGTCCRSCLAKWHAIPKGVQLTNGEVDDVVEVIGAWLRMEMERT